MIFRRAWPPPVHLAVIYDNLPLLKELAENKNADLESRDKTGSAPIFYTRGNRGNDILEYLIKKGANVNSQGMRNQTVGYGMIHEGARSKLELLLKNGLKVNKQDDDGSSLMYIAV